MMSLSTVVSEEQWALYRKVVEMAQERGLRYALGGGLAFTAYSGRVRNTKDLDLFVLPAEGWQMIDVVTEAGFHDYYDENPYDRTWIYRGIQNGVIVDLIWAIGNHRASVDEDWFRRGREIEVHGFALRIAPAEEFFWSKLYMLIRDRTDWPDLLNILYATGAEMDWEHFLNRVHEDSLLLGAVLSVFRWMCPARARDLPAWLWEKTGLLSVVDDPVPGLNCREDHSRVSCLDMQDWFGPTDGSPRPPRPGHSHLVKLQEAAQ